MHSVARRLLFGDSDAAHFTGRIVYRTTFPAALLQGYEIDDCTKWWGPDRHVVNYYVRPDRSEVYFVTSQPEPEFTVESSEHQGRCHDAAGQFRRVPSPGPPRPGRMSRGSQVGAGGSRPAADVEPGQRHPPRRRLSPHDPVHGPGRGDGDRGRGSAIHAYCATSTTRRPSTTLSAGSRAPVRNAHRRSRPSRAPTHGCESRLM